MDSTAGARTFLVSGDAYGSFMGRYSQPLATVFADVAGVADGHRALDVGCGPGALTAELVDRLGPGSVFAIDPSPPFVAACSARCPGVDARLGSAEALPFDDQAFDRVLSQLVLHFVTDPEQAASEFCRVVRPGGVVAACVWDFDHGMEMLRCFWDAALEVDRDAPDEARVMRFGRSGEIASLLQGTGLEGVAETTIEVAATYRGFEELWSGFLAGIGPAGAYCASLSDDVRAALRSALFVRVGSPTGRFTMAAIARCASGVATG